MNTNRYSNLVGPVGVVLAVVLSVFFIVIAVDASSTISTNVSTDGNLTVTGTTDLTGLTTLVNASTTVISTTGDLFVGGNATTTGSSGNIATEGTLSVASTLSVTGASTLTGDVGIATSTPAKALGVAGDIIASTTSTGSATTTVILDTNGSASGGCLQMKDSIGATTYRAYLISTTTNGSSDSEVMFRVEAGTCQ